MVKSSLINVPPVPLDVKLLTLLILDKLTWFSKFNIKSLLFPSKELNAKLLPVKVEFAPKVAVS